MSMEKKTTQQSDRETLVKAISGLLDETIAEVEKLTKGEVTFANLSLQPDEDGGMAAEAHSDADQFKQMKKEKEEEKKDEAKEEPKDEEKKDEMEKQIPPELSEAKEDKKDDEKKDEAKPFEGKETKEEEEKEEEAKEAQKSETADQEYEKFKAYLQKAMVELGFIEEELVEKSEEAAEEEIEKVEAPAKDDEELKKALTVRDEKIGQLEKSVTDLTEKLEKVLRLPQERKALSGLKPIKKSDEDGAGTQPVSKNDVLDKLLVAQKSGDKRVTPVIISKFELSGDYESVRDIVEQKKS